MIDVQPWGRAPTPLLPIMVREAMGTIPAPMLLSAELGRGMEVADLDHTCWGDVGSVPETVLDELTRLVTRNKDVIETKRAGVVVPSAQVIRLLPFRTRTRNCGLQIAARFEGKKPRLSELLEIRSFGVKSLLDLFCVLEAHGFASAERPASSPVDPRAPLVPRFLRHAFGSRTAPPALRVEGSAPTIGELSTGTHLRAAVDPDSARAQLIGWFHALLPEAADLVVVSELPTTSIDTWKLSDRTLRVIEEREPHTLVGATVADLIDWGFDAQSILDLASRLDLRLAADPAALAHVLNESWAEMVSGADPRFRDLLETPETIGDQVRRVIESDADLDVAGDLADRIQKIESRLTALDANPFDREIARIVGDSIGIDGDRLEIMRARLGLSEPVTITLEEAGRRLGVTRERIRQIGVKIQKALPEHPLWVPTLDAAIELVAEKVPLDDVALSRLLREHRLVAEDLSPESFLEHVRFAKRETDLVIDGDNQLRNAATLESDLSREEQVRNVTKSIRRLFKPFRIAQLGEAERRLRAEQIDFGKTARDEVDEAGAVWLDGEWFWLVEDGEFEDSPLTRLLHVILSVAYPDSVAVQVLHGGLERRMRWRKLEPVPPVPILRRVLEEHPLFSVDGDLVSSLVRLDARVLLAESDRTMLEVLREAGGVLNRQEFERRCLGKGMNPNTFTVMSTYSPVVEHLDVNLWGLRGVTPNESAMTRAAEPVERERRALGIRSTPTGFDYAYRLAGRGSEVLGVPAAIRPYVSGRSWLAVDSDGNEVGTVMVDGDSAWGFTRFLNRAEADGGEVLMTRFDVEAGIVTLEIVTEDEIVGFL